MRGPSKVDDDARRSARPRAEPDGLDQLVFECLRCVDRFGDAGGVQIDEHAIRIVDLIAAIFHFPIELDGNANDVGEDRPADRL